jgi:hypothetical protein
MVFGMNRLDDQGIHLPPYSVVCSRCLHLIDWRRRICRAFPSAILDAIWLGMNPHIEPVDGDGGFRFEPAQPDENHL